ncbi:MAG: M23 family metallopeptidase [Proteobacteria bacterium]|nr:M23 family metallopeptidase [Pseudomonadota bacterium]
MDARLPLILALLPALGGCELPASAGTGPSTSEYAGGESSEPAGPSECAPVATLTCGDVVTADTGSFNDGATDVIDHYAGVVGSFDGPEIAYALDVPAAGEVTLRFVDPVPTLVDHDILVLRSDAGTCAGADAFDRGANNITLSVDGDAHWFVVVDGYNGDAGGFTLEVECAAEEPIDVEDPDCAGFHSDATESASIQITAPLPPRAWELSWTQPAAFTNIVDFQGANGSPAGHEGIDYIHDDEDDAVVDVLAAADGTVAYVRTGCPESERFAHNTALRECGSGWGNHVIVDHGEGLFTRYAHLAPGDVRVEVGASVVRGEPLGGMGNSGRSETRHLHFELGTDDGAFDPCAPTRSFDFVHPPAALGVGL